MTADERQPWRRLRELEPPLSSKRRVLGEIEADIALDPRVVSLAASRPIARTFAAAAAAVAIAAGLLWLVGSALTRSAPREVATAPSEPAPTPAIAAPAPAPAPAPVATPADAARPARELAQVVVERGDRIALALSSARLAIVGPAEVQFGGSRVSISHGQVVVAGFAEVAGPGCDVVVDGTAEVTALGARTRVKVAHGSIDRARGDGCQIVQEIDLSPDPEPRTVPPPPPAPAPAAIEREADPRRWPGAADSSGETIEPAAVAIEATTEPPLAEEAPAAAEPEPLREQVQAFRRARALADREAIAAWRSILDQWPDSPLRHEAEAALIDTLVRLGRDAEAARRARQFLDRFPSSTRADSMRQIAGEATP